MHVTGNARWRAQVLRMNIGTIVEAPVLKVRLVGKRGFGPTLGEVEEYFASTCSAPGDTFMFAGRLLRFIRKSGKPPPSACRRRRPAIPAWCPPMPAPACRSPPIWPPACAPCCTTHPPGTPTPSRCANGWNCNKPGRNCLPPTICWWKFFQGRDRWYLVAYTFEGRNAHQTLGMLLTRRMERAGYAPLGFVATDYVIAVWSANEPADIAALFDHDMMGEDLEAWMAESSMLKRTFRNVAVIAGLVDRHQPGAEKNRRQVTVNTDLIYNVLRRHQARPYPAACHPRRCRRRPDGPQPHLPCC